MYIHVTWTGREFGDVCCDDYADTIATRYTAALAAQIQRRYPDAEVQVSEGRDDRIDTDGESFEISEALEDAEHEAWDNLDTSQAGCKCVWD